MTERKLCDVTLRILKFDSSYLCVFAYERSGVCVCVLHVNIFITTKEQTPSEATLHVTDYLDILRIRLLPPQATGSWRLIKGGEEKKKQLRVPQMQIEAERVGE